MGEHTWPLDASAPPATMKPLIVWLIGGLIGFVMFGAAGFGIGLLYLWFFAGPYCCGLEGLFPPVVATVGGAGMGILVGGLAALLIQRRQSLHLGWLAILWLGGLAAVWGFALVVGEVSVERTFPVFGLIGVMFFAPVGVWIAAAYLSARSSI